MNDPVIEWLEKQAFVKAVAACGSQITCDPAPTDTDRDYLVEVRPDQGSVADAVSELSNARFHWEGSEHYQDAAGTFMSWRKDNVNLIVTSNSDFAAKHRVATNLCRRLNLLDKKDRIALFQAVLYGVEYDDKKPVSEPVAT